MHALIVIGHHDPQSLTHALAAQIAEGLADAGHSSSLADLATERFDPRFGLADHAVHRRLATAPADVLREQARIERADALVLVYPVYWWSMPALLKGWVERVFSNGWAFDYLPDGRLIKKLDGLPVQLVGLVAPTRARSFGMVTAMPWRLRSSMESLITAVLGCLARRFWMTARAARALPIWRARARSGRSCSTRLR